MAKLPVQKPTKPEKRRPKEEDYVVINLSMLTRFSIFVDEVRRSEGPVSFRFFMNKRGSHRTMALTVDTIEKLSQQLLLRREVLDDENRATGRYLSEYEGLEHLSTKRTNGVSPRDITPHGYAWAEMSELIDELMAMVMDKKADPREVTDVLHSIRVDLAQRRSRTMK